MVAMSSQAAGFQAAERSAPRRSESLALMFQEILTVIVRLRSNRQAVENAEVFRANMQRELKKAAQEASMKGYSAEDVKAATFAVVALLDESVLNSHNPVFADWARKPMQEELFGVHEAGEYFFRSLERLLARKDSSDLADLLEVYYLCLLLGYRGRYSMSGPEDLRGLKDSVAEKIRRIRGPSQPLSTAWAPSSDSAPARRADPWVRRLALAVGVCFLLALVLLLGFKRSLSSGASELSGIASQGGR